MYNQHWERLYANCVNWVSDPEVAKELVQNVFFSLWERRKSLVIQGLVSHYLLRAAKLKTVEYYRTHRIHQHHFEQLAHLTKRSENSTENTVLLNELTLQVQQFVEALPQQCRRVYELSRTEGLATRQIATELVLSEKTVKNHLTRALGFIRDKLAK